MYAVFEFKMCTHAYYWPLSALLLINLRDKAVNGELRRFWDSAVALKNINVSEQGT